MNNKFAIFRVEKIKTKGQLTARYNHDYRVADVKNANPDGKVYSIIDHINDRSYTEAFNDRINFLPYYQSHTTRKNAVLALDIMLTVSHGAEQREDIDMQEWLDGCQDFLKDTFDVAPDQENVISAVLHQDESTPHIHAIVIPIDEKGKLNASRFIDGAKTLRELQDKYYSAVKASGLERGNQKSHARHQDIRAFYGDLNRARNSIPEPEPNETAYDYRERVRDDIATLQGARFRALLDNQKRYRELLKKQTEEREKLRNAGYPDNIDEVIEWMNSYYDYYIKEEERKRKIKECPELVKYIEDYLEEYEEERY